MGRRNFGTTIGRSLPEWKTNESFNWLLDRHSVFVLVRYIYSYEDNQTIDDPGSDGQNVCLGSCIRAFSTGNQDRFTAETAAGLDREIDSWTTVDVQYSYELPQMGIQAEGSRVSIGGTNVLNEEPPLVKLDGQFDPFVHDPRGAVWYLRYTMAL